MNWHVSPLSRPQTHLRHSGESECCPRYIIPRSLVLSIATSVLLGGKRSLGTDALRLAQAFTPSPCADNIDWIPRSGAFVLVTNHYYKLGYRVWWGIAWISAVVAQCRPNATEMIWLMANRWTYTNPLQNYLVTPLTHAAFTRLARTYGFVSTPPMPRQDKYTEEGVQSVRHVLSLLSRPESERPPIGIAPEGRDSSDGSLIEPPPGTGRFLLHMTQGGLNVLPVGIMEQEGALTARFGPPFPLRIASHLSKQERDRQASTKVMVSIGKLLPSELWGVYRTQIEQELEYEASLPSDMD